MSRILFATVPVVSHVTTFLPLARALVARGHEVGWYTGAKYKQAVERTGATFYGYTRARDFDDADIDRVYPRRAQLRGVAQLRFDMKHVFIDAAPDQLADLRQLTQKFPADLVLADPTTLGALFLKESGGPSCCGIMGVMPLMLNSDEVAPFGLGIGPSTSIVGRIRNRVLHASVQNIAFRDVQTHWNRTRATVGLPATGWWLDSGLARASFYLQPSVPAFEYPRSNLPSTVHFIGMMPAERPADVASPSLWPELNGPRPVVHVTQGTIANTTPDLFAPAIAGLRNEDVWVVITTGNRPVESLGLGRLPGNVRVAPFFSYPELLPKTSLMLTNGGFSGVQTALSYGVPLVVAPGSQDKPEVAARVAWSGTGLNLKTGRPTPQHVKRAVRTVLADARYRARARLLQAEYQRYDALERALAVIDGQLETQRRKAVI